MDFTRAIIAYDLVVLAVLAADFALIRRTSASVVARGPAVLLGIVWLAGVVAIGNERWQFAAIGAAVLLCALFGYANFLAFVKRGVTFSILHNHSLPREQRRPDADFIAIDERLIEMSGHGWTERTGDRWSLTAAGHRVVRVRRALLRILRIEAVG